MKNRRDVLKGSMLIGAGTALGMSHHSTANAGLLDAMVRQDEHEGAAGEDLDRQAVMTAGFTEAEAECWKKTAEAAGTFFNLPELHPMDKQEVAMAIHILQNKLLSRPTYRKYLEEAKRLRE